MKKVLILDAGENMLGSRTTIEQSDIVVMLDKSKDNYQVLKHRGGDNIPSETFHPIQSLHLLFLDWS